MLSHTNKRLIAGCDKQARQTDTSTQESRLAAAVQQYFLQSLASKTFKNQTCSQSVRSRWSVITSLTRAHTHTQLATSEVGHDRSFMKAVWYSSVVGQSFFACIVSIIMLAGTDQWICDDLKLLNWTCACLHYTRTNIWSVNVWLCWQIVTIWTDKQHFPMSC